MRTESGGYRTAHRRALALRIEVNAKEIRIMGSKTLAPAHAGRRFERKNGRFWSASSVLKWRTRHDSNVWPSPSEGDALSS